MILFPFLTNASFLLSFPSEIHLCRMKEEREKGKKRKERVFFETTSCLQWRQRVDGALHLSHFHFLSRLPRLRRHTASAETLVFFLTLSFPFSFTRIALASRTSDGTMVWLKFSSKARIERGQRRKRTERAWCFVAVKKPAAMAALTKKRKQIHCSPKSTGALPRRPQACLQGAPWSRGEARGRDLGVFLS